MDEIADRVRELLLLARDAEQRAAGYRAEAARLIRRLLNLDEGGHSPGERRQSEKTNDPM
jgi:hypothetical protein